MPYVMMPVPEEHVEQVMQFILREMSKASLEEWDAETVGEVYAEVDEATRSLLAFVARATLEGEDLADTEASQMIQLTARETAGLMNELVTITRTANRPQLIVPRVVTERLPNGRSTDKRVLSMELEVAELIRAAERDELRDPGHPLGESPE